MIIKDDDLNGSAITYTEYEVQTKAQRAFNTLIRWTRTAGRAIAYPFKKVGYPLYRGFANAYNASSDRWQAFKTGCYEGWKDIEFKPSKYGLQKTKRQYNIFNS